MYKHGELYHTFHKFPAEESSNTYTLRSPEEEGEKYGEMLSGISQLCDLDLKECL